LDSKEYKERERARDVLVASYVSSYDVSSNPSVMEGESMQSVKKNRRTLVEQWSAGQGVVEDTDGDGKQQTDEDEHRRYDYKDPSIQLLHRSYLHLWGKTKGEHIGWRNYKEWKAQCKHADIPDAPEASFRRWKKFRLRLITHSIIQREEFGYD
jgi:hypothetical protein